MDEENNIEMPEEELEEQDNVIEHIFFDPIPLSNENLVDISEFDSNEFKQGIKDASKECGMFTAYINAGMSNVQAYELILNKLGVANSLEVNKLANATAIEVSKYQNISVEKTQL